MFPVQNENIRTELIDMLNDYFRDNCHASVLDHTGTWTLLNPLEGEKPFRVQKEMLSRAARVCDSPDRVKQEYTVRRSPPAEK
jgi:polyphosphate kinase